MGARLDIFGGPVAAYVKVYAASNDPVSNNVVSWAGWTDWGRRNEDAIELGIEGEVSEDRVAQLLGTLQRWASDEKVMLAFTAKAMGLSKLPYLVPGMAYDEADTPGTDSDVASYGGGATFAEEYSLGLQGYTPAGLALVAFIPKATATPTAALAFQKRMSEGAALAFESLEDDSRPLGERQLKIWGITEA